MSVERAYANLQAIRYTPSDDVQKEIQTLAIAGIATLQAIERMQAVIDDLEERVGDIEKNSGVEP